MTLLNAELHINVSILKENICYLKTRIDKKAMEEKIPKDIHADGTCTYIILTESPCK